MNEKRQALISDLEHWAAAIPEILRQLQDDNVPDETAYVFLYHLRWELGHIVARAGAGIPITEPRKQVQEILDTARRKHQDAAVEQPRIVKVLDLSTAHIPEQYSQCLHEMQAEDVIAYQHSEYGYLMWVPAGEHDRAPTEIQRIIDFARSLGCEYVLFDRDADVIDDLPHWDW